MRMTVVALLVGLAGCAHRQPSEGATIAAARSFTIHLGPAAEAGYWSTHVTPAMLTIAGEVAGDVLAARGYRPAMAGTEDLLVEVDGGVRATGYKAEAALEAVDGQVAPIDQRGDPPYDYIEGTIDIRVFDARTRQLLWRKRRVELIHHPGRVEPARVRRAVEHMLAGLPSHTS
jgi:hypothetical protein